MQDRIQREKDFHEKTFSEGGRHSALKYYDTAKNSIEFFKKFLANNCAGGEVLEYGCGMGSQAPWLAKHGAKWITGIDIANVAIDQVKQIARAEGINNVTFKTMNAENLEFADNSFDLVYGTGILHHLDLEKSYAELSRTLKPSGKAIFREPLGHNPFINLYRRLTPRLRTEDEHPLLLSTMEIARRHFHRVETHYFHFFSIGAVVFRNFKIFPFALTLLEKIDKVMFQIPPLKKFAWMVMIILSEPMKATASVAGAQKPREGRLLLTIL